MKDVLKVSVIIKAPAEKVWHGLTDPKLVKQYFFGTEVDSTWKKGSPIFFRGQWDGKAYEDKGTILSIHPGQDVSYSYWSSMSGVPDLPENYHTVSYHLTKQGSETQVTISQETEPAKKEHSEKNWRRVLDGLKKVIESL